LEGYTNASILAVSPIDPATIASAVDGLPDRSLRGMVGAGLVYLAGLRWPLIPGGKQAKRAAAGRTLRNVTASCCRRRAERSGAEATILTSLARSWKMIANQTDRYIAIMKKDAAQKSKGAASTGKLRAGTDSLCHRRSGLREFLNPDGLSLVQSRTAPKAPARQ
jgi:hypothetical protein